jgi:hypothetical protein
MDINPKYTVIYRNYDEEFGDIVKFYIYFSLYVVYITTVAVVQSKQCRMVG